MDGLVMTTLGRCAATISSQESRLCSLVSSIHAARQSCYPHKKGAGLALTRLPTLRHNNFVREHVHGEKVLTQPMTSE
jgi:hypothetical protein